jgi:hypothetical protein
MGYVMRHGRRIEVVTLTSNPSPVQKRRRKSFEPRFVMLPRHWISALKRSKSARTYELAHIILWEAFKDKRGTGEVILSSQVTGMSRSTRRRAARELVELGLITVTEEQTRTLRAKVIPYSVQPGDWHVSQHKTKSS